MIKANTENHLPRFIRLDMATACQLKCPACPTATGEIGKKLGTAFLKFADFKKLIDENPWVSAIELSNWGEIFLNKELHEMMRYAYKKNVALYAANGVNLNTVKDEVLEALVKYKLRSMTCSIDGATQETYVKYRVNGNLDHVLANIRQINYWKAKYRSVYPRMTWQYVAFGHNEHEIENARQMAAEMNMRFFLKLSWDDLYTKEFSPVRAKDMVRKASGLGVASREEYRQLFGSEYIERKCCLEFWKNPQINVDGRVLGCSVNYWADFGNAFTDGLKETINGESLRYARAMLMGKAAPREGIACSTCKVYHRLKKSGKWAREEEFALPYTPSRRRVMLENKFLWAEYLLRSAGNLARRIKRRLSASVPAKEIPGALASGTYALSVAHEADTSKGWRPYLKFSGPSGICHSFSCHSSALAPGFCPHPPHAHKDEEILMMLSGEAELIFPSMHDGKKTQKITLLPGQFVYYPAEFLHTLKAGQSSPANYLMFKWFAEVSQKDNALGYARYDLTKEFSQMPAAPGFRARVLFEGATHNLSKLHCHLSTLMPDAGYEAHIDPYDVAIVVLEGSVETLGQRVEPQGIIFYRAGEPHGMRNPGESIAKYVVFEFHK